MPECEGPKAQICSGGDSISASAPGPLSNPAFPGELGIEVSRESARIKKMVLPMTSNSQENGVRDVLFPFVLLSTVKKLGIIYITNLRRL